MYIPVKYSEGNKMGLIDQMVTEITQHVLD